MSILIDTSALIAARNAEDRNHKSAVNNMNSALKGEYGKVFTSDYVFDEAVTLAYMRTGKKIFAISILKKAVTMFLHGEKQCPVF